MTAPRKASVTVARDLLTQWSEQEGCTVVSRYEGDRWDKLVDIIATALDAQVERDAKVCESVYSDNVRAMAGDEPRAVGRKIAVAIRQQVRPCVSR